MGCRSLRRIFWLPSPHPGIVFLGFVVTPPPRDWVGPKKNQGVIWGKRSEYFETKSKLLETIAGITQLHSVAPKSVIPHPNITYHGHMTADNWRQLLLESKFLIGLGDPLLGPSALEAVSLGSVFINPIYDHPKLENEYGDLYTSQHPYLRNVLGPPAVCSANLKDIPAVVKCVENALLTDLKPQIPADFTYEAYMERLKRIFADFL